MSQNLTELRFQTLVSGATLAAHHSSDDWVVLDCRSKLGEPEWGDRAFVEGHVPGALRANLDRQLAGAPGDGGRHPLPDRDRWLETVRSWGIGNHQQVVVYDDAGGAYAARAWWMLRWLGHRDVAVLDGGLAHWPGPLESGPAPATSASRYTPGDALTEALSVPDAGFARLTLIDARTRERWAGVAEPVDAVAGHIPGAQCLPFQENLAEDGTFLDAASLHERLAPLFEASDPVVSYCGSGVTACHNILACCIAGLPEPALYVGSWSGWITDPTRPVARA